MGATVSFTLSRKIVALQVETSCCPYYHPLFNLPRNKCQCCKLQQYVAQSRPEFYFLQQIFFKLGTLTFVAWKVEHRMVIRATTLFNLQCNNVARQGERNCCPYHLAIRCGRVLKFLNESLSSSRAFPSLWTPTLSSPHPPSFLAFLSIFRSTTYVTYRVVKQRSVYISSAPELKTTCWFPEKEFQKILRMF